MSTTKFDFGSFEIVDSALSSTATTFTIAATKENRQGVDNGSNARYYEFPDETLTNFRVTVEQKGGSYKEKIGIASVADASNDLSDGRKRYTLTLRKYDDGSTLMRGIKQNSDGTNAIRNQDTNAIVTSFPVGSKVKVVWDTDEQESLAASFTNASNEFSPQPTANGAVGAGVVFYLDSNGKAVAGTNSGAFDGVNKTATTDGNDIDGYRYLVAGITVPGSIGDTIYATSAGVLTATAAGNTRIGRKQASDTLAIYNFEAETSFADDVFEVYDNGDSTKKLEVELSGATTAKTVTLDSNHTDDRTHLLPDASGTLLSTGLADVPTDTLRIQDNTDTTKEIAFDASGITTGTTRTITMPDADVDLDDISKAITIETLLTHLNLETIHNALWTHATNGGTSNRGAVIATGPAGYSNGYLSDNFLIANAGTNEGRWEGKATVGHAASSDFSASEANAFIGMASSTGAVAASLLGDTGAAIGFLFEKVGGNLNIYAHVADGSGVTDTLIQTFVVATEYEFKIIHITEDGTEKVKFYVDGANETIITTNIPTTTTYPIMMKAGTPNSSTASTGARLDGVDSFYICSK